MGAVSANELAGHAMRPTWAALDPVKAHREALIRFLHEELPADTQENLAGINAAMVLAAEFRDIWPHRVPSNWELVLADRAGNLAEKIRELNEAFAREQGGEHVGRTD